MKNMNGKPVTGILAAVLVSLMASGCQSPLRAPGEPRQELSGERQSQTCRSNASSVTGGGPDAIYAEMVACVKAQQFDRAVFLYGLAGSYTWFDAERIGTQYAKMAHGKRLGAALAQLTEKQHSQFWDYLRATMNDNSKKNRLCAQVKEAGMPTHSTGYMRLDKSSDAPQAPVERYQWEAAVNNYLTCN